MLLNMDISRVRLFGLWESDLQIKIESSCIGKLDGSCIYDVVAEANMNPVRPVPALPFAPEEAKAEIGTWNRPPPP